VTGLDLTANPLADFLPTVPLAAPELDAPTPALMDKLSAAQALISSLPQVPVLTEHLLHGGMYARTIRRGAGVVAVGSVILRATILIVHGDCTLLDGSGHPVHLSGYSILPGLAGRKSLSLTHGPMEMTMIFPTSAQTVEEAEREIFGEAEKLASRREGNPNQVTITSTDPTVIEGGLSCPAQSQLP
jgi:hypothetical protein